MKKIYLASITLCLLMCIHTTSWGQEQYSRLKIYTGSNGLEKLARIGLAVDHGEVKRDAFIISDFSETEKKLAEANGFKTEVLIPNLSRYYAEQSKQAEPANLRALNRCRKPFTYKTPAGFTQGSMGGYFTYDELLALLDSMTARFPSLISARKVIGNPSDTTIGGHPLFWLKISDNPQADENEPEVLYTALHHAREPQSLSQLIYYMFYLLENYNTDSSIQYIVNNTELYFVPCVNPDGYIYNQTTNPNGGGLWRKNRRDNGDGTFGVDINRNYGYKWGLDNLGSSDQGANETFRGTAGFSEAESQIMKKFCESRKFIYALNAHTWGDLLIYPWGYQASTYTPDSALFENVSRLLIAENNYTHGTDDQTVHYITNGSSDDWMYGEQSSKDKIYAMTPEIGGTGFWPDPTDIEYLCQENIFQNLSLARLVVSYAKVTDETPYLLGTKNTYIYYTIQRLGMDSSASFIVKVEPVGNIKTTASPKVYTDLKLLETRKDSIAITIDDATAAGSPIIYRLVTGNGSYILSDTIEKRYGPITVKLDDPCNNLNNWTPGITAQPWSTTTQTWHSPGSCFTDSKNGDYADKDINELSLTNPVDLRDALEATLTLYMKLDVETRYDYFQVLALLDSPAASYSLCGTHIKPGGLNQQYLEPLYDGQQFTWVREEFNLHDFIGHKLYINFRLTSDDASHGDGVYIDDIKIESIQKQSVGITNTSDHAFCQTPFPNPASDYIEWNCSLPNDESAYICIRDITGRVVLYEKTGTGKAIHHIAIHSLPVGTYLIQVQGYNIQSAPYKLVILR